MVHFVEENPRLQVAVLAHHWSIYTGKTSSGTRAAAILSPRLQGRTSDRRRARSQVLRQSLEQTIDFFEKHGVHVVLLGEVPLFDRDPSSASPPPIKHGLERAKLPRPASEVQELVGAMNALLADLARRRKNVSFFSPLDTMCDEAGCSPVMDGVYMYRDRGHLNRIGAEHLARSMRLPHMLPRS